MSPSTANTSAVDPSVDEQRSLQTPRAPYAPPALRRFALTHSDGTSGPTLRDIAVERFRQRFNVHNVNNKPLPHQLHQHFLTDTRDRRLAVHEATQDIRDAVTGMDNVADVIFVGFAIRPEWDVSQPFHPEHCQITTISSHHIDQHPEYKRAVQDLRKVVQERIAFPHIYTYHDRLHSVSPGYGYVVDAETGRIRDNAIRLAEGIQPPSCVDQRRGIVSVSSTSQGPVVARPQQAPQVPTELSTAGQIPLTMPAALPRAASSDPVPVQTRFGTRYVRRRPQQVMDHLPVSSGQNPQLRGTSTVISNESPSDIQVPPMVDLGISATRRGLPSARSVGNINVQTAQTATTTNLSTRTRTPMIPLTQRNGTVMLVPAPAVTMPLVAPPPEPVVVPDSDSDEPSSPTISELGVLSLSDREGSESDVESWVRTPDGSPPRRTSRRHDTVLTASAPPNPDDPPPEYSPYLQSTIESFGFHPDVAEFLTTRNLSPAGLVRIDSTLDYHVNDWRTGFLEAGLSETDARQLRRVVIQSLPASVRDALITAWAVVEVD